MRVIVHGKECVLEDFFPLAFIAATVCRKGRQIRAIEVLRGKWTDPKIVDCEKMPVDYDRIEFDAQWVATAITENGKRYRYDYKKQEWASA